MTVNTELLVPTTSFQEILVDSNGDPMTAGVVTCYRDNNRAILKNWYYQSGSPGAYTYVALPNPLTLSAAGTVADENGVDTIPFFYPYSEDDQTEAQPYYIVIENSASTNQITRENFPFVSGQGKASYSLAAQENYIINNVFWRNQGTVNLSSVTNTTLAPSQHDGFQYPDLQFFKNNTSAVETVSFPAFPLTNEQILEGDPTPEYYLSHECTNTPSAETFKYYQFPISFHVNTLASQEFTFSIQGRNLGASTTSSSTISVYIYQDLGLGAISEDPFLVSDFTLGSSWGKHTFTGVFPPTSGLTLSSVGNDALYLQIWMPLNTSCEINFTKPSIYLSDKAPVNSFQTYDQINSVVNTPRTGDVRMTLNAFSPFGWVPANDGTIGSAGSSATTRANVDTWPLYNLIYNAVSDTYAPVSGGRGDSAYDDFIANKAMALTKTMGRVLGGTGAGAGLTARALGEYVGDELQTHTITIDEIPAHTHTYAVGFDGSGTEAAVPSYYSGTPVATPSTSSVGSGDPFDIPVMQPSVFYNVFFKL